MLTGSHFTFNSSPRTKLENDKLLFPCFALPANLLHTVVWSCMQRQISADRGSRVMETLLSERKRRTERGSLTLEHDSGLVPAWFIEGCSESGCQGEEWENGAEDRRTEEEKTCYLEKHTVVNLITLNVLKVTKGSSKGKIVSFSDKWRIFLLYLFVWLIRWRDHSISANLEVKKWSSSLHQLETFVGQHGALRVIILTIHCFKQGRLTPWCANMVLI